MLTKQREKNKITDRISLRAVQKDSKEKFYYLHDVAFTKHPDGHKLQFLKNDKWFDFPSPANDEVIVVYAGCFIRLIKI